MENMAAFITFKRRKKDRRRLEGAFSAGVVSPSETAAPGFTIMRTIEDDAQRLAHGLRWKTMIHRKTLYRSDETNNCFLADTVHDNEGYWALDGITYVGRWKETA